MNATTPLALKVWGDFACFTRPELKVERVSYPVMTPAAARGVLEAVFWKPEFKWQVREIHLLRPVRYYSILRNEVRSRAVAGTAQKWSQSGTGGFFAEDSRTQRHTLALREVAYLIYADIVLQPHATDDVAKYRDQFRRRVSRGQCHHTPYLGNREFAASFAPPDGDEQPVAEDSELGTMLFDLRYETGRSGRGVPVFFNATLRAGVMQVPQELYD